MEGQPSSLIHIHSFTLFPVPISCHLSCNTPNNNQEPNHPHPEHLFVPTVRLSFPATLAFCSLLVLPSPGSLSLLSSRRLVVFGTQLNKHTPGPGRREVEDTPENSMASLKPSFSTLKSILLCRDLSVIVFKNL